MDMKKNIEDIFNCLGIWDGLLYLEYGYSLLINQHLFLRYNYHNLEPVKSYFNVQEYEIANIEKDYETLGIEEGKLPNWLKEELRQHTKNRMVDYHLIFSCPKKRWEILDSTKQTIYFLQKKQKKTVIYSTQKWQIYFSFTSPDRIWNLISYFSPILFEGTRSHSTFTHEKTFINFLEMLNGCIIERMYHVWKKVSLVVLPTKFEFFKSNPIFTYGTATNDNIRQALHKDEAYFPICQDIVLGVLLSCVGRGLDKAHLEWGMATILERIFQPLKNSSFQMRIEYNVGVSTNIHPSTRLILGQNKLGKSCLGEKIVHTWEKLRIHILTPSWEIYLLLHPNSHARKFLQKTLEVWLSAQNITPELQIVYQQKEIEKLQKFASILGEQTREGICLLGYTSFLVNKENLPTPDECKICFDRDYFTK